MNKEDAIAIPELQIHPDGLVEDCFFYKLSTIGKVSPEQGRKALQRTRGKRNIQGALFIAEMMIENLEKYGVACIDWCE